MNKTPKKKKSALRVISMSNKKVTEIYKKKRKIGLNIKTS